MVLPTPNPPFEPHEVIVQPTSRAPSIAKLVMLSLGVLAIAVIALVQLFDVNTYWIPSESMSPTINRNARIVVWDAGDADRGDIVIFTKPEGIPGQTKDLMHRVVGLGGETISFRDGQVFIDDRMLIEPYLEPDTPTGVALDSPTEFSIPDGHVFVMGDNRSRSSDCRFFGAIPEASISANHVWAWRGGDEPRS